MQVRTTAEETKTKGEPDPRPELQPVDSPVVQNVQLVQFLRWLTPLVLAFTLLEGVAFLVFRDVGTGVAVTVLFGFGCLMLVARAQVRRGRRRAAVILICVAFLSGTLIMVPAQPALIPTLAISPLMAVAVALPYTRKRVLGLLIIASWAVIVAVGILGELIPSYSTLPAWYDSFFRVASLSTTAAVVLLLLWQFRERLMGTLEQVRTAEKRLQWEATHDLLTGLPNRTLFTKQLDHAIERAKKDAGYSFAVLFLDLDRFKNINDSLGHDVGDLLLKEIARRLRTRVHATDAVARLGGDEFVVLLENTADLRNATEVAKRLQDEIRAPLKLYGHELFTTASIGVVLGSARYDKPEELLRDADTAMYRAKEGGKARHAVFDVAMRTRAVSLLRLETDLRRAVEQGEFVVYYQPIVWLASGEVMGFEALVRWKHPERGLVPPKEFVLLAEETGLIDPIGLFVLREACAQAALWHSRFPDHRPLTMSVNVSGVQLARPDLADKVANVLEDTGVDGRALVLEITESALIRDEAAAAATFSRLKDLGVQVYVDDFGTGHSSLAALHRYPVDALKIDRSFVSGVGISEEKEEIVQTISSLAHHLGMNVAAEGIETSEQLERLREMGCDRGQGSLFSRPITGEAAEAILATGPTW